MVLITKKSNRKEKCHECKIGIPEVVEIFKEIREQRERLFEMIRFDIRETVGQYLTAMMNAELSTF